MRASTAVVFVVGVVAGAAIVLGVQALGGRRADTVRGATPAARERARAPAEVAPSPAGAAERAAERVAGREPDIRRELEACRGSLAAHATLPERFEAAEVDVGLTATMRAKFGALMTGPSTLDSFECRNGVCLARVTNAAVDPAVADRWLADFQARRGEFFDQMRVRTLPQGPDSTETELMFEPPTAESPGPALASVLGKVSDAIAVGVPGCEHGRASVELRVTDGVLESEVIGSACLATVVDEAVRGVDLRGRSNALMSEIFRW